jgi:hypothetical protein
MARRAAKTDDNQPAIVEAFRDLGCKVHHTHMVGKGFPDIVVAWGDKSRGPEVVRLVEIKDGSKPPSKRVLTEPEAEFHESWPVEIVETIADVERLVREWRGLA